MLEAGEDPLFIARRMVIFASEDVGNADPQALQVAVAALQAFHAVGLPEGWIPLSQAVAYLASAPKSNASYMAYRRAVEAVKEHGSLPIPLHLRNAPTALMKVLGYGRGYEYPHDFPNHIVVQENLPEQLRGDQYYDPSERGSEKGIKERLKEWRTKLQKRRTTKGEP
jgi:putative ATPase